MAQKKLTAAERIALGLEDREGNATPEGMTLESETNALDEVKTDPPLKTFAPNSDGETLRDIFNRLAKENPEPEATHTILTKDVSQKPRTWEDDPELTADERQSLDNIRQNREYKAKDEARIDAMMHGKFPQGFPFPTLMAPPDAPEPTPEGLWVMENGKKVFKPYSLMALPNKAESEYMAGEHLVGLDGAMELANKVEEVPSTPTWKLQQQAQGGQQALEDWMNAGPRGNLGDHPLARPKFPATLSEVNSQNRLNRNNAGFENNEQFDEGVLPEEPDYKTILEGIKNKYKDK